MFLNELEPFLDDICEDYFNNKLSTYQIAKKYDCYSSTIVGLFKRHNIKRRTSTEGARLRSSHTLNEHFLDEIDTEEKAYFLGFFFADGYNSLREGKKTAYAKGTLTISVERRDEEILYKFRKIFDSDAEVFQRQPGPIYNKNTKKTYYPKPISTLNLNSVYLSKQMSELGGIKGKTYSLSFPKYLPNELIRHFIRGVFDGDGSICRCLTKSLVNIHPICSLVGALSFLEEITNIIEQFLGFKVKAYWVGKPADKRIGRFAIYDGNHVRSFLSWLYEDATIYLERKYNRYYQYYHNGIMFTTYEEGGW